MRYLLRVMLSFVVTGLIFVQGNVGSIPAALAYETPNGLVVTSSTETFNWLTPFTFASESKEMRVIPGGQSIGIKLHASGILVVGYHLTHLGKDTLSPAEQAHVRIGDMIVAIDGKTVTAVDQVTPLIEQAGEHQRSLQLTIRRKGNSFAAHIRPVYDAESGAYRLGLFIRDSASGVGTLTFYVPQTHLFGALGHVIADADTGQPIEGNGQIVHATVTSIDRGESGQPGEKRGSFVNDHLILGHIARNTEYGVFGTMDAAPDHGLYDTPLAVATASEVHIGPATMLTVVSDQRVQAFEVQIVKVNRQSTADVKGMVIRVTDPALLAKTGGIVQGMSGSPILQDGKLIGAVTHVFVSDPTQGYGIYAQWMLSATGNGAPASALRSNVVRQAV